MKNFKQRLMEASYGEALVGAMLTQNGFTVKLYPNNFDRKKQASGHYSTRPDLVVYRTEKCRGNGVPVEVKSLKEWTGFVCSTGAFSRRTGLYVKGISALPEEFTLDVDHILILRDRVEVVWIPKGTQVLSIPTPDPWGGNAFPGLHAKKFLPFQSFLERIRK